MPCASCKPLRVALQTTMLQNLHAHLHYDQINSCVRVRKPSGPAVETCKLSISPMPQGMPSVHSWCLHMTYLHAAASYLLFPKCSGASSEGKTTCLIGLEVAMHPLRPSRRAARLTSSCCLAPGRWQAHFPDKSDLGRRMPESCTAWSDPYKRGTMSQTSRTATSQSMHLVSSPRPRPKRSEVPIRIPSDSLPLLSVNAHESCSDPPRPPRPPPGLCVAQSHLPVHCGALPPLPSSPPLKVSVCSRFSLIGV